MSTPVEQLRAARQKIDNATRAVARSEAEVEAARKGLESAVRSVAQFVPVAGKTHDQLIADLEDETARADQQLAASIRTLDTELAAYVTARGEA